MRNANQILYSVQPTDMCRAARKASNGAAPLMPASAVWGA